MDDRHARHRRPDADPRRRPVDGFRTSSPDRFRRLVDDAVAALPRPILQHLHGVQVRIRELPEPAADPSSGPDLARYEPRLGPDAATPTADVITVFRRPLEARATSRQDLTDLIRDTVARELADHLGIDDDGLGWG